jgi:hypothetical protein
MVLLALDDFLAKANLSLKGAPTSLMGFGHLQANKFVMPMLMVDQFLEFQTLMGSQKSQGSQKIRGFISVLPQSVEVKKIQLELPLL